MMNRSLARGRFALVFVLLLVTRVGVAVKTVAAHSPATVCDPGALTAPPLEGVRITGATSIPAGQFTPPRATTALRNLPAFCRIEAQVTPREEPRPSLITFEVWVPSAWNGKLVTTGNGGYSNALSYRDMANALAQGYAVVGGDTGHQSAADDLLWGQGHPERIADWGTRSVHAITVASKAIVQRVGSTGGVGQVPRRTYFYGCSTGGHQAYAEMQRYPADFDGVIAGAPGNNRVRLNIGFLWQYLANHREGNGELVVPARKLPLLTQRAVAACDANDGVTDGVVDDPRTCRFDPSVLQCSGEDRPDCLTSEQVGAVKRMYAGARNPRTGETIYPGWPLTSEALTVSADGAPMSGWHQYWGAGEPTRANFWRAWLFDDPKWNPRSFDFDRDVALAEQRLGPLVDHTSVDLAAFKSRGGKAIVFQGWQDPVVNAVDTIAYYERLRARQGAQAATDEFFRLFLVAGMGHCGGGTGAVSFGNGGEAPPVMDADHDLLMALDAWVERGRAPERLIASKVAAGRVTRTRPLCTYPRRATYSGSGSTDRAENFVCRP